MKKITFYITMLLINVVSISCKKYLETKPDNRYSTISTVADVQSILDNAFNYNQSYLPNLSEYSSDDYYFNSATYNSQKNYSLGNVYIWGRYPFKDDPSGGEWGTSFNCILIYNTVLNALDNISGNNLDRLASDNARGIALANRGYCFWRLATTYSKAYNISTAATDLGIPIRLGITLDDKTARGSVQQTYDQIIKDLTEALPLLPTKAAYVTRPSKASVNAVLAEVYLSMRNYDQAVKYADAALILRNDLIDYNALDITSSSPFPSFKNNTEILIWYSSSSNSINYSTLNRFNVDTLLYQSYKQDDLRKRLFFTARVDSTFYFSGNYSGAGRVGLFSGPTTAEMYLIRAECFARQGKTTEAMQDLNTLLKNRISSASFVPYSTSSSAYALQLILQERRKELIFRDTRWMDIKRLNIEGANIILKRNIDGQIITLLPNDNRYALQLPESVIQISGMEQNPY